MLNYTAEGVLKWAWSLYVPGFAVRRYITRPSRQITDDRDSMLGDLVPEVQSRAREDQVRLAALIPCPGTRWDSR